MSNYFETRPWGTFEILAESKDYKIKKITVNPHSKLSLQSHKHRQEHWFIISGQANVTLDTKIFNLTSGQAIDIPRAAKHRAANETDIPVVFIEIQTGSSFDESDIERFEDDYNRPTS